MDPSSRTDAPPRHADAPVSGPDITDPEALAARLDAHPDYRVLRRLPEDPRSEGADARPFRLGLYVDVETTGTDAARDAIIELAMILFGYDAEGRITGIVERFDQLEDPGRPIPREITALTGIRDDDVRGRRIDDAAVSALVARANLVIAHNAGFDRAFLEKRLDCFRGTYWACSAADVPWRDEGLESRKLEYLVYRFGCFYDGHRAIADCVAGVHLLSRTLPRCGLPAMARLREEALREEVLFRAVGAKFETKDALKARGYRWRPERKVWWKRVPSSEADEERRWLSAEVYGGPCRAEEARITARDRYSSRAA